MLDFDYSNHYASVVQAMQWQIQLPPTDEDFFSQSGLTKETTPDRRGTQRRNVRLRGLMVSEQALPSLKRDRQLVGVYTKDFSKDGVALISPVEWFPEESVRLILPSFWLSLKVERCIRLHSHCYEIGLSLSQRHDPDRAAFIHSGRFLKP